VFGARIIGFSDRVVNRSSGFISRSRRIFGPATIFDFSTISGEKKKPRKLEDTKKSTKVL
jgi:hypothetical protein